MSLHDCICTPYGLNSSISKIWYHAAQNCCTASSQFEPIQQQMLISPQVDNAEVYTPLGADWRVKCDNIIAHPCLFFCGGKGRNKFPPFPKKKKKKAKRQIRALIGRSKRI